MASNNAVCFLCQHDDDAGCVYHPCACKGSMGVHEECMRSVWWGTCKTCMQPYRRSIFGVDVRVWTMAASLAVAWLLCSYTHDQYSVALLAHMHASLRFVLVWLARPGVYYERLAVADEFRVNNMSIFLDSWPWWVFAFFWSVKNVLLAFVMAAWSLKNVALAIVMSAWWLVCTALGLVFNETMLWAVFTVMRVAVVLVVYYTLAEKVNKLIWNPTQNRIQIVFVDYAVFNAVSGALTFANLFNAFVVVMAAFYYVFGIIYE